jgi:hypothetical protein
MPLAAVDALAAEQHGAGSPAIVVRTCLPRSAPTCPCWRISRSVHRAASWPSTRSRGQIFPRTESVSEAARSDLRDQCDDLAVAQRPSGVVVVGARRDRAAVLGAPCRSARSELVLELADVVDDHRYGRSSAAKRAMPS